MDELPADQSLPVLAGTAGRRAALGALSAAGMALLAGLGLAATSDANKESKNGGGHDQRKRAKQRRRTNRREQNNGSDPSPDAPGVPADDTTEGGGKAESRVVT